MRFVCCVLVPGDSGGGARFDSAFSRAVNLDWYVEGLMAEAAVDVMCVFG